MNSIGQSILETINISLFNAEPTNQKLYQIYKELRYAGIEDDDPEVVFNKIQMFFKKRTIQNQGKLFVQMFKLHYADQMRSQFSLSYRTSDISYETISNVACDVYRLLLPYDVEGCGIDERILYDALLECYKPRYFEDEWRVGLTRLYSNIRNAMIAKNRIEHLNRIEELFHYLENFHLAQENKSPVVKQSGVLETTLVDSTLKDSTKIKEGEMDYIKSVLKSFEECPLPEMLNTDLFPSSKRHPKVTEFFLMVKNYNSVIHNEDMTLKDILDEMNFMAKAVQEIGREICDLYEQNIRKTKAEYDQAIKIA